MYTSFMYSVMDTDSCEFLRIISLNVRGIGTKPCFFNFLNTFYSQLDAAVFMLQETHGCEKFENYWSKHFRHKLFFSHGSSARGGLMIGVNKNVRFKLYDIVRNEMFLIIYCNIEGEDMVLVNVYLPVRCSLPVYAECLQEFWVAVLQFKCERIIVGGDWNATMYPDFDRTRPVDHRSGVLRDFVSGVRLSDVWRVYHPGERVYTYARGDSRSRLDMFMVSQITLTSTIKAGVIPVACSDHDAIFIDIFKVSNTRGPGLWRFSNWLLDLPSFTEFMTEKISSYFENSEKEKSFNEDICNEEALDRDSVAVWEGFKSYARQQVMSFMRTWRKKTKKYRMVQLSHIILELESRSVNELLDEEEREAWQIEANKLRTQLLEVSKEVGSGKGRDEREVKMNADMFVFIECSPGRLAGVFYNDRLVRSAPGILSACDDFYTDLYVDPAKFGGESIKLSNFDFVPEENCCSIETRELLEEGFLMEDFFKALSGMKRSSAPGKMVLLQLSIRCFGLSLENILVPVCGQE